MAIVRYGPLIGAISGRIGGAEFANTRAGAVAKKAQHKIRRSSTQALTAHSNYERAIRAWQDLTASERREWRAVAQNIQRTNRLGLPRTISAFQLFLHVVIPSIITTGAIVTTPPDDVALSPLSSIAITDTSAGNLEVETFVAGAPFNTLVEIHIGWLINRQSYTQPRRWHLVWGGSQTPTGNPWTIYPGPALNPPVVSTTWANVAPPQTGWKVLIRARRAGLSSLPTPWVFTEATIT